MVSRYEHIVLWPGFWALFQISTAELRVSFRSRILSAIYLISNHGAHVDVGVRHNLFSWMSLIVGVAVMHNFWNNFIDARM